MADPITEVVPRVVLKESLPATPAPGSVQETAARVRKNLDEQDYKKGTIELVKKAPVENRKLDELEEKFGVGRDATGNRALTPRETTLKSEFKKTKELAVKFTRVGYEGLSPAEKGDLENDLVDVMKGQPVFAAIWNGMNPTTQKEWIRREILKDPKNAPAVARILEGIGGRELGNGVDEARDEAKKQEDKQKNKDLDIADVTRQLTSVQSQLDAFKETGGTPVGPKAIELQNIINQKPTLEKEIETYTSTADDKSYEISSLEREETASLQRGYAGRPTVDIRRELSTKRNERDIAQREAGKREALIKKLETYPQEKRQLEDRKTELEKEKRERETEKSEIDRELQKRQQNLADATRLQLVAEEDITADLKNVFKDAAVEVLQSKVDEVSRLANEDAEKRTSELKDQNEIAIARGAQERWHGAQRTRTVGRILGMFGGREDTYRPIDRAGVDRDYATLITQGPEALMENVLVGTVKPGTQPPRNYNAAEARELVANKDFRDKMQPEIVTQLLGKRVLSGKISAEDVEVITTSDWGRGAISKAIELRKEVRGEIEKVFGEDALNRKGFWNRFGGEVRKHPWWFLLLFGGLGSMWSVGALRTTPAQENIAA